MRAYLRLFISSIKSADGIITSDVLDVDHSDWACANNNPRGILIVFCVRVFMFFLARLISRQDWYIHLHVAAAAFMVLCCCNFSYLKFNSSVRRVIRPWEAPGTFRAAPVMT